MQSSNRTRRTQKSVYRRGAERKTRNPQPAEVFLHSVYMIRPATFTSSRSCSGHRNISTTQNYLGVNYADAKAAVESIALISESDTSDVLSNSLGDLDDETLITEFRKRGYKLVSLSENDDETTAEILKNRITAPADYRRING